MLDSRQWELAGVITVDQGGAQAQQSVATLYEPAILAAIDHALEAVSRSEGEAAARELMKAHAAVIAQAGEIQASAEMAAAEAHEPGGPDDGGPPPVPPPLRKLLNRLGAFGRWLWNLIGALLIPKEWTIEGGVSLAWMADAKISVTFG